MKEKIEIEEDRVKLMRLTPAGVWNTEVDVGLEAFLEFTAAQMPQSWEERPVLPPGCRWYGKRYKSEVLILEEPPMTRRIRFAARTRKQGEEAEEELYTLGFPYVILAFYFVERDFEEMKVFYRQAPLASMKDELCLCNLYNVQLSRGHRAHNRACLKPKPEIAGLDLQEQVQRLTTHFWSTEFNLDIEDSGFQFYARRDGRLASLSQWEKEAQSDPFFSLQFPWEPAQMTLGDVVAFFMDQQNAGGRTPFSSRNLGNMCYALADAEFKRPVFDHKLGVWRQ